MKKLFVKIAFVVAGLTELANAQQDPQFTQFMYNKLIYNPDYIKQNFTFCRLQLLEVQFGHCSFVQLNQD